MIFQWDEKNVDHIGRHGVSPVEAEYVVRRAAAPFPRQIDHDKNFVWGRTESGRYLQVIFVYKGAEDVHPRSLHPEDLASLSDGTESVVIRVVHAMNLTPAMLRRYRKLRRGG